MLSENGKAWLHNLGSSHNFVSSNCCYLFFPSGCKGVHVSPNSSSEEQQSGGVQERHFQSIPSAVHQWAPLAGMQSVSPRHGVEHFQGTDP